MPQRARSFSAVLILALSIGCNGASQPGTPTSSSATIDHDLLDVTIPTLHQLYKDKKYTVTQVVQWHLDRIDRYNGIYGAVETLFRKEALAEAARQDADTSTTHGALWGVPIVVKANTSVKGYPTTAGWAGFVRDGHELIAPKDATIVDRFRKAGAIILGAANMPDLANSDTNRSTSFGRTGNAYDVRFSPGGSSGGIVTAVAANFAVLGNGTDTGNSIRMPAATSALVGVFPTRGLVSIAGIAPLDWLLDNTGPITRTATDAAIALGVMTGADPLDARTNELPNNAQQPPYDRRLKVDALKGKRFGVPAFILAGEGVPFHGIPYSVGEKDFEKLRLGANVPLTSETRAMFMKAVDALRKAGAEVVFDDAILPVAFARAASRVATYAYMRDGTDQFLQTFGPAEYHSAAEYQKAVGSPLYTSSIGTEDGFRKFGGIEIKQRPADGDPEAQRMYHGPKLGMRSAFLAPLEILKLDGYVYPAIQMPPPDESMPQDGGLSGGPHSATSWVNMLGVPAVVVPAGFYDNGLPFGLEFAGKPWTDGDLLGYAYAWEQATQLRKPPVLVESGLLKTMKAREPERR